MEAKKNPKQDLQRQSFKFFLIGLSLSVALIITAFEWRTKKRIVPPPPTFDTPMEVLLEIKPTVHEVTRPTPAPVKKSIASITKSDVLTTFTETDNPDEEQDDAPEIDQLDFSQTAIAIPTENVEIIFTNPELKPMPVGGYRSFYEHLSKSIRYPHQAQRNHTEGKVFIEFIIDQQGKVTNPKVVKGIGNGCDEEALRVLLQTQWQPGKQRGIPVLVRMTLPLTFQLN